MSDDAVSAALTRYPELRSLVDLRDAGWTFIPVVRDREVTEVKGVRVWSPSNWTDAVMVRESSDAGALRLDAEGYTVWHAEGGLVEVVDGLVTLPPPGTRLAPRLARARGPALWTPECTGPR